MNRTAINHKANNELFKLFNEKGICLCELKFEGCDNYWMLSYAHRFPRRWYYDKPDETLWDFNQVLLACVKCHQSLDDRSITSEEEKEQIFNRLRPEGEL